MKNKIKQKFDYFLVLDFEATCDDKSKVMPEIIEFPTVAINAVSLKVELEFHEYVTPKVNPKLTKFCTSLTGITQETVEKASPFKDVIGRYSKWVEDNFSNKKVLWITCGDWDLRSMLPKQCEISKIEIPNYFKDPNCYVNIKRPFGKLYGRSARGMKGMLGYLKLELQGKHHSGIDDCRNIGNILVKMVKDGCVFDVENLKFDEPLFPTCFNCGENGHKKAECPKIQCRKCNKYGHISSRCKSEKSENKEEQECYQCGKTGHFKRNCPEVICRKCGKKGHFKWKCPN